MGVEFSRSEEMKSEVNEKSFREKRIKDWELKFSSGTTHIHSNKNSDSATLGEDTLGRAGKSIKDFLDREKNHKKINILEVGSGNRYATKIVTDPSKEYISGLITTDIMEYPTLLPEIEFHKLHSIDAVSKFGDWADVLLLISPIPGGIDNPTSCSDYYACYDFIKNANKPDKLIIFIGELGASDGTIGMYKYLIEHPMLELRHRSMTKESIDTFGGEVEKEIFIFRIFRPE